MRSPLLKRIPRELKQDIGKYVAIFLFLTATIGFVSGFLVADGSMKTAYNNSFAKYNIEDGHFELSSTVDATLLDALDEEGVSVYNNFYTEQNVRGDNTLRIFENREKVNLACVMEGALPVSNSDIALDRMYAENNNIKVGDKIDISDQEYSVCGLVALSDYSALFKNNSDMIFDAQKFSVALVTKDTFALLSGKDLHYCYSWLYKDRDLTEVQQRSKAESIFSILKSQVKITDFVKQADNQSIHFTGNDMGQDKAMMTWMLYLVMAVLAFVFAVTTKSTIEHEATVIGTLRASGYKRGELLLHYLLLPLAVTFAAACAGNILGYTLIKNIVVKMYYASYSLPSYETIWNGEAFVLTTVIPCVIILAVNLLVLAGTLSLPPLAFLRRDLSRRRKQHVIRLNRGGFLSRFRLRVIFQNAPTYITMMIGILLADILLLFGMIMTPLLDHYKADVIEHQVATYQYILKAPVETINKDAEKYCVSALNTIKSGEEISVYGIKEGSKYLSDISLPTGTNEVTVSDGYLQKYSLRIGDTISLQSAKTDDVYTFTVKGSFHYPATLAVFMTDDQYRSVFNKEDGYFSGYFSNSELADIDVAYVASTITRHDLISVSEQMNDSMGSILPLFGGFAVILFILIVYLLSKLIIDKNTSSISLVKILGYSDREISRLYNVSTAIVVGFSLLLSLPLSYFVMRIIFFQIMQNFNGWLDFYVDPFIYPEMLLLGIVSYAVISYLQSRRIRVIKMSQALKNME